MKLIIPCGQSLTRGRFISLPGDYVLINNIRYCWLSLWWFFVVSKDCTYNIKPTKGWCVTKCSSMLHRRSYLNSKLEINEDFWPWFFYTAYKNKMQWYEMFCCVGFHISHNCIVIPKLSEISQLHLRLCYLLFSEGDINFITGQKFL